MFFHDKLHLTLADVPTVSRSRNPGTVGTFREESFVDPALLIDPDVFEIKAIFFTWVNCRDFDGLRELSDLITRYPSTLYLIRVGLIEIEELSDLLSIEPISSFRSPK